MTDAPDKGPELYVDSDWKEEARREKERLSAEVEEQAKAQPAGPGEACFLEVVELFATQAIVSLGGAALPTGEHIPPNLEAAKRFVDLLGVLKEKTKGNLSEEEDRRLSLVLGELQQTFTRVVMGPAPGVVPPGTVQPDAAPAEGDSPLETT